MRLGWAIAAATVLASCGPAPSQTELRASTPAMAAVCAFRLSDATERAQQHCTANGSNARWVRRAQECRINDGPADSYTFLTGQFPDIYQFDCVR